MLVAGPARTYELLNPYHHSKKPLPCNFTQVKEEEVVHKNTQQKANMNAETHQLSVELLNVLNGHVTQKLLSF